MSVQFTKGTNLQKCSDTTNVEGKNEEKNCTWKPPSCNSLKWPDITKAIGSSTESCMIVEPDISDKKERKMNTISWHETVA